MKFLMNFYPQYLEAFRHTPQKVFEGTGASTTYRRLLPSHESPETDGLEKLPWRLDWQVVHKSWRICRHSEPPASVLNLSAADTRSHTHGTLWLIVYRSRLAVSVKTDCKRIRYLGSAATVGRRRHTRVIHGTFLITLLRPNRPKLPLYRSASGRAHVARSWKYRPSSF